MDNVTERIMAIFNLEGLVIHGSKVVLILLLFLIARSLTSLAMRRLESRLAARAERDGQVPTEAGKRANTLARLIKQGIQLTLWLLLLLMLLKAVGVDIAPILAGAGVVGVALGFGAQNLVRDIIAGFFIILENQIRIGDVAVINGQGGLVEGINFRTVILRDMSGTVHIIPNGTINTMANMTRDWSAYLMDIGIAYKEDPDQAMAIMKQVAEELQADEYFGQFITKGIEVFGVDNFADSAVVIRARLVTQPIKQWEVGREYRRRLKMAFDAAGIEIPFPHRSLYIGEASKPLVVQMAEQQRATV